MSAIFHLELDTPLANAATPPVDVMEQDFSREESVVVSGDSSAVEEAAAGGTSNYSAAPSPGPSVSWGTVAPSPDNSQPLQGPWGRLQEVCVVNYVITMV